MNFSIEKPILPSDYPIKLTIIEYNELFSNLYEIEKLEDIIPLLSSSNKFWLNVDGLYDSVLLQKIGDIFQLHSILVEDIANFSQRPKSVDFGENISVVLKMLSTSVKNTIEEEQVTFVLGHNYVISFQQDKEGDIFDSVRTLLKQGKGKIRKENPDYLLYRLLDAIIDGYFTMIGQVGYRLDNLEEHHTETAETYLNQLYELKRDLLFVRRAVWPLREILSRLERTDNELINPKTAFYFKDIHDHTNQVIDTLELYRDMLGGMMDLYLNNISLKMNNVMRVLTIISTIFIPLTFIAGVYGMNFEYMPELHWHYGYWVAWGIMGFIVALMILFFKIKKWL